MFRMLKRLPPPHGWRAVGWELAIVTLGVVIALAAQQAVEALHWRSAVKQQRRVLLTEVTDNLNAIQDRLFLSACIDRKLDEIEVVLDRSARRQPFGIVGKVGLPLPSGGAKGAWNIALAGQGLAHMPHGEQVGFSNAYTQFDNWDRIRAEEREAWLALGVLDRPATLVGEDWVALRQAYARAVAAKTRIDSVGPFIFRTANMGQRPFGREVARQRFNDAPYGHEICEPLLQR